MATLENIRKRGVLLSIVIGGSLLAFILGGIDFQTMFGESRTTVATVDGKVAGGSHKGKTWSHVI